MVIILLGLSVGLVMSLTGAGGGIIGLPLLVFFLDISMVDAAPIALSAVAVAATLAAILGFYKGTVRYKAAMIMALAGTLLSPLGVLLAHKVGNDYLMIIFSIILGYIAYKTVKDQNSEMGLSHERLTPCSISPETGRLIWTSRCSMSILTSGAAAGFLSGLLGVGGGFIIVPALHRFTNLTLESIVATSLAVIALISISVLLTTFIHLDMNWALAIPFSAGAMVGMMLGKLLLAKIKIKYLKYGFSLLIILVAVMLLIKGLNS